MYNYFKSGLIHFSFFLLSLSFSFGVYVFSALIGLGAAVPFITLAVNLLTAPFIYGFLKNRVYDSFEGSGLKEFFSYGIKEYFFYYLLIIITALIVSAPLLLLGMIILFIIVSKAVVYVYGVFSLAVFIFASGVIQSRWLQPGTSD